MNITTRRDHSRVVTVLSIVASTLLWCGCRSYPWSPETMAGNRSSGSSGVTAGAATSRAFVTSKAGEQSKDGTQRDADYAAQLAKARALERAGKLDAAREVYERLIVWAPDRYEAYHRLAVICDKQQRFVEAESLYAQAIRLNPANPDLFNDLGYCYLLQGKFDKAERALRKAVGISPANERYRNNLGLVYGYQGRYAEALEQFRRGGSEPDAWYNLAYVQWVRSELDSARQSLERALTLNPGHELAKESLARLSSGQSFLPENVDSERSWRLYRETAGDTLAVHPDNSTQNIEPTVYNGVKELRLGLKNRPNTQTQLDVARSSWVQRVQQGSLRGEDTHERSLW